MGEVSGISGNLAEGIGDCDGLEIKDEDTLQQGAPHVCLVSSMDHGQHIVVANAMANSLSP